MKLAYDEFERELKFFNWLEGGVCTGIKEILATAKLVGRDWHASSIFLSPRPLTQLLSARR
jgi:hypothetical protein